MLDHLDEQGMADDTIVLFVTDNDWIQRPDRHSYGPRSTRTPYEGGVRTPIMVRWPGRVLPGIRDGLASSVDLAPTVLRACRVPVPETLPGRDLIAVSGGSEPARPTVFDEIFAHDVADVDDPGKSLRFRWLVQAQWKLIVPAKADAAPQLYDVMADPTERRDLANELPERATELRAVLDRWWDGRS